MPQKSFYLSETFDLGNTTITYTAAGLASAKYTVGKLYMGRLDGITNGVMNGYLSVLWSPGSGTAGTIYVGLYAATGTASTGTLYLVGTSANVGGQVAGLVRTQFLNNGNAVTSFGGSSPFGVTSAGSVNPANPEGILYGALLVAADAGTNHVDLATSTAFAANGQANTDPTSGEVVPFPRALTSGSSLTTLPASVAMSGASTSDTLLPYFGLD